MILYGLTWIGSILGFVFMTYSLATGLYYLSEFVEEYSVLSKKIIKWTLLFVAALHPLLWIEGQFPFWKLAFSAVSTLWYYRLLANFPVIDISGPIFVVSCVLAVCNHFNWFFFFKTKYFAFNELVSFFGICVWLIPFMFMVSLSANDMALPFGESNDGKKKESFMKNWLQGLLWNRNAKEP